MNRVVVVGASLAAVHVIERLRADGFSDGIVLVGAERHLPYDRPPLSKEGLRCGPDLEPLREPGWYDEMGVTLRLGRPAVGLRPEENVVVVDGGDEVAYDGLVIATGSRARTLSAGNEHVAFLRSVDDAVALRERLGAAEHVAIIGAGFIGLEVAATVTEMGRRATVIEVAPAPLARVLGDEVGVWFRNFHARRGVPIRCGTHAVSVEAVRTGYRVNLGNGDVVAADLVVGALGATPAIDWLRDSGIALSDGVLCDRSLRANAPGVVAAGDVARWFNPLFDEDMRVEQWTNAVDQGRHAARVLLGAPGAYAPVPYFWSDQFDARMRFVGRANGAEQVHVESVTDDSLVAVFGRNGVQVGALCVNATSRLPHHRAAIAEKRAYAEAPIG
ncbi:NAD(P)/FAD-dependent oxidoreductase [Blastococcus goldschmidtiae]|uniref:FAD-dependent oxidoreductase n=1 Tax=Blastococcus goldschmidtiae TaxID=3075546 RepID=A0ABU2K852_9ACTN|nr:FAD-dependent oxidoreductase [Blastococcus sp. DSM 46792]MDT0276364.1 FAD-dependent oxidoreductase [Blastococcus sp. DSM 46792]